MATITTESAALTKQKISFSPVLVAISNSKQEFFLSSTVSDVVSMNFQVGMEKIVLKI